ncbi:MAG TPA: leucine--tRNA ligase [Chloroflexota bacterium]
MVERYNPQTIEPYWRERWEREGLYKVAPDPSRPKYYALVMFPYTSGDLHIGHWYNFAPADTHARYKRMRGFNVLEPIGFDAFGLPAEEAAIKHGIHPRTWTIRNIERMTGQLKTIGAMYDWSKSLATCYPEYYRWNQWFFLQLYRRGLAYRALAPANWCTHCQTVLANEQVIDGRCERCSSVIIRRDLEQWFFKITAYAEELLDFSGIEWPERVVTMQRNWIGKSHGVEFRIPVEGHPGVEVAVFTTRPDTVFGMTYVVLAPEHPLVERLTTPDRLAEVRAYQEFTRRESEIERLSTEKEKTGVFIGSYAINPANGRRIPIWIADYVLLTYGTGAIHAVPAHDERDFEFARKFGLPIVEVIRPEGAEERPLTEAYVGPGVLVNSGPFDGLHSQEAWERIADWFEERGIGKRTVNYRLRDWLISRQRYWGTPIPIVYCDRCGIVPVPEDQLPVLLPEEAEFRPTGESPLKYVEEFVSTTCPTCAGPARRETDTMDTFVDSSWYFLRYVDPAYQEGPFNKDLVQYWLPVDQYMGGVEHAVMHLLYARFFTKVLRDLGLVDFGEPFLRLFNQGIILGPDGLRMSKSRGNVVNPDDYVAKLGSDTVRCYLMFIGPWDSGGPWNPEGINGVHKFLNRVWALALDAEGVGANPSPSADQELQRIMHKTIARVTDDMEKFRFNTMLAALMSFSNEMVRLRGAVSRPVWDEAVEKLLLLLAPSAPHLTEELWHRLGHDQSIHLQPWPTFRPELLEEEKVTLVIQVNGKVRDKVEIPVDLPEEQVRTLVMERPRIQQLLDGRTLANFVYVPNRLVNLVIR